MTGNDKKTQTIEWIVTGVLLALGLYNQLAQIKGWAHIEIGDATITAYVTWFYELLVGLWAYWHNNNVTPEAQVSQQVLNALRDGMVTEGQVEDFLDKTEKEEA